MQRVRWMALMAAGLVALGACGGKGVQTAGGSSAVSGGAQGGGSAGSGPAGSGPSGPAKEATMPNVVGLTESEARRTLSDAGLDAPNVTTKKSFETAGHVLDQVPSAGRAVTGGINLTVAEAIPPVPEFVGKKIADVRAWAEPLGVDVRVKLTLNTDKPDGEVLDQLPAAGAQASREIVVGVVQAPTVVSLSTLEPVDRTAYSVDDINMDGNIYPKTGVFETSTGYTAYVAVNLSRRWETLEVTLGLDDTKDATASVQVEFVADGKVLKDETVVFGATKKVKVDVNNVLRLQINTKQLTGKSRTRLGLGNAKLIGAASTTSSSSSTSTTR